MVRIRDEWYADLAKQDVEESTPTAEPRRKPEKLPTKRQWREQLERKRWGGSE